MRIKHLIPLSIFILSLTFTSCEESGIVPTGNTISGQIVYGLSTASNVEVVIGNESVITDNEGRFTINNVSFPYDLSVIYLNGDYVDIFMGLNNFSPIICIGGDNNITNSHKVSIYPELPIPPNSEADLQMFFKPTNNMPIVSELHLNTQSLNVYWNSKYSSLTGKLIILYKDGISQSYTKFYQSDEINLSNINNIYVLPIDSSEFTFDPDERVVNGYVYSSLGNSFQAGTVLSFSEDNPWPYPQPFFGGQANNNISITIPDIPVEYNSFFFVENYSSPDYAKGLFKYTEGGNNNFNLYPPPVAVTPVNDDSVSLYHTDFVWSQSEGNGVYRLLIYNHKRISVYTTSINARIPDLSQLGFDPFEYGHNYQWRVMKLFDFSGMDEFVSENYSQNGKYVSNTVKLTPDNHIILY